MFGNSPHSQTGLIFVQRVVASMNKVFKTGDNFNRDKWRQVFDIFSPPYVKGKLDYCFNSMRWVFSLEGD